ncbi:MAG: response regulator transcription factor [Planctomycetota bacterium]|jgi:DNA-binding response OmpR family regulator
MQDGKHVILCVDDDEDILFVMQQVLEANGYIFAGAASGEEGLKAFKETNPDLMFVDLMMEEVDAGTNLVKELRLAGNTAPVLMLSSVGDSMAEMTDYSDLGLAGILQKPIESEHLLSLVKGKLGGSA